MKILVVAGYCLRVNSSANLCHLSYINGLLDAGHEVDLLTVSEKNQVIDPGIKLPPVRNVFTYDASWYEQMGNRRRIQAPAADPEAVQTQPTVPTNDRRSLPSKLKAKLRKMYGPHRTSIMWYFHAKHFRSKERYDLTVSLSDPPASHKLVGWLRRKNRLHTDRWIQIWEDPWSADIYGYTTLSSIRKEEFSLLACAERVLYVSPLTLLYQKREFPGFADKMDWMPLPAYYQSELTEQNFEHLSFGYFGDYISHVRDLEPFYQTANELSLDVRICGNSDAPFASTDTIQVYPRMPLGELKIHEDHTNALVFLCNRKGGQIPGKIYQYSATNKLVLFILDGTPEEKAVLKDYFSQFDRYIFCDNNRESISQAIRKIQSHSFNSSLCTPLAYFEPKQIIAGIIEKASK